MRLNFFTFAFAFSLGISTVIGGPVDLSARKQSATVDSSSTTGIHARAYTVPSQATIETAMKVQIAKFPTKHALFYSGDTYIPGSSTTPTKGRRASPPPPPPPPPPPLPPSGSGSGGSKKVPPKTSPTPSQKPIQWSVYAQDVAKRTGKFYTIYDIYDLATEEEKLAQAGLSSSDYSKYHLELVNNASKAMATVVSGVIYVLLPDSPATTGTSSTSAGYVSVQLGTSGETTKFYDTTVWVEEEWPILMKRGDVEIVRVNPHDAENGGNPGIVLKKKGVVLPVKSTP